MPERASAKNPDQRFATATELVGALAAAFAGDEPDAARAAAALAALAALAATSV